MHLNKLSDIKAIRNSKKKILEVQINGQNVIMELDSGAPTGIISKKTLHAIKLDSSKLQPTDRQFVSYSRHPVKCIGRLLVNVTLGHATRELYVYIVDEEYDSLFGLEWIGQFVHDINWTQIFSPEAIHNLKTSSSRLFPEQSARLDQILAKHDSIFSKTAGKLIGPPVKMHLKPGVSPVFARARDVPHALRDKYAKEIDAKIASGFITLKWSTQNGLQQRMS